MNANRPSARRDPTAPPKAEPEPQLPLFDATDYLQGLRDRRQRTRKLSDDVLEHMRRNPEQEFYCVEIAKLFACNVYEAKYCLQRLEDSGLLQGHHEAVHHSGQGRRYYKLRGGA